MSDAQMSPEEIAIQAVLAKQITTEAHVTGGLLRFSITGNTGILVFDDGRFAVIGITAEENGNGMLEQSVGLVTKPPHVSELFEAELISGKLFGSYVNAMARALSSGGVVER